MAIKPSVVYPGQTVVSTAYPHGAAQNITVADDGTGTPLEKTWVNDLWGFLQALLRANGDAVPSGTPDTVTASQYLSGVKAAALAASYENPIGANATVAVSLDRLGVYCTSEAEIQAANDYFVANLIQGTIHLPAESTIGLGGTLNIDLSYTIIEGHRSLLLAPGMPASGTALTLVGTATLPIPHSSASLKDLSILGPGRATTSTGIDFGNAGYGANGPTTLVLDNVYLKSFNIAAEFGSAEYPIVLRNCGAVDCGNALDFNTTGPGSVDMFGGLIDDCDLAVDMAFNTRYLAMHGVEVRDCLKLFSVAQGKVEMFGCKLRAVGYAVVPMTISGAGGSVVMHGGELRMSGPGLLSLWVDVGAGASFQGSDVRLVNTLTSGGAFASGAGRAILRGAQIDNHATECYIMNAEGSMVADGGFEAGVFVDEVFVTAATVAITDKHSAGGTALSLPVTGTPRTGAGYLRFERSGTPSRAAIACVPVRPFDRMGGAFYWARTLSAVGTLTFRYIFVKLTMDGNGVPVILSTAVGDTTDVVLPAAGTFYGYNLETFGDVALVAPAWATHFVVEMLADAVTGTGGFQVDDLTVNIIG